MGPILRESNLMPTMLLVVSRDILKKKIVLFGLVIHHDPCDLRSSIPK